VVPSAGEAALAHTASDDFDLVISDLRMPRLGGREFYEELARRRPELAARLVFSTGDTVRGDTLAFLESLDRPYLHKPFSLAELRRLLDEIARESGPHVIRRDSGSIAIEASPPS
jgi:DNA-binding response OmpR family regulator